VVPDFRETELRNAVERLSGDLCISRPKSRLSWGIELPFDRDYVNYVWFDALSNYISFAGYDPKIDNYEQQPKELLEKWPALQTIGKDILVPAHGIYWPTMLHAIGFPDAAMPRLLVHGWWNLGGAKMSKTAGNVIDPFALADKYGVEALRYYLMSDIATGKDADFSEERLIERYNADLANSLGNLLNRALTMMQTYRQGRLRVCKEGGLVARVKYFAEAFDFCASKCLIDAAGEKVISLTTEANQFIEQSAPWKMAKQNDSTALDAVLYELAESLRIMAILISPVLPKAAHGIFDQLNWKIELSGKEERFALKDAEWGGLSDGHVVGKPVPLFPRIEL
jgi:methionyl-tRNA synthetase